MRDLDTIPAPFAICHLWSFLMTYKRVQGILAQPISSVFPPFFTFCLRLPGIASISGLRSTSRMSRGFPISKSAPLLTARSRGCPACGERARAPSEFPPRPFLTCDIVAEVDPRCVVHHGVLCLPAYYKRPSHPLHPVTRSISVVSSTVPDIVFLSRHNWWQCRGQQQRRCLIMFVQCNTN